MERKFTQAHACLGCSIFLSPLDFDGLWWCRNRLSCFSKSSGNASLKDSILFVGSLYEAVWFPVREWMIHGACSAWMGTRNRN